MQKKNQKLELITKTYFSLFKSFINNTKSQKAIVGSTCFFSFYLPYIFASIEFKEERKVLLEVIGPELQSIYDDRQIEVGLWFK